jgi:hypothetical protein
VVLRSVTCKKENIISVILLTLVMKLENDALLPFKPVMGFEADAKADAN